MSVSESFTLPAQPTTGSSKYVPLAGNGYTAPQSAYAVAVQLSGDATGGSANITVRPDPQYASILSYASFSAFATAAAVGQLYQIINGAETAASMIQGAFDVVGGLNPNQASTWTPPLLVLDPPAEDPQLVFVMPNEDGVTFSLNLRLYNFRKGVQNVTPLPNLVAALPRGTSSAP